LAVDSKLNAHLPFIMMLRDQGRLQAEMWLERNFHDVGDRSSVNLAELFS